MTRGYTRESTELSGADNETELWKRNPRRDKTRAGAGDSSHARDYSDLWAEKFGKYVGIILRGRSRATADRRFPFSSEEGLRGDVYSLLNLNGKEEL